MSRKCFCLTISMAVCLASMVIMLLCHAVNAQTADSLFSYDRTQLVDVRDSVIGIYEGATLHDLSYVSPKQGRVTAYLFVPAGAGPFPAILFGHSGLGTRTEFLPEAKLYAKAGVISLLVDYPWVRPAPWRQPSPNFTDANADRDVCIQAVIDLRRGIDLLLSRPDVDPGRLAYIGHSYGAQWGAILSAVDDRVKAAVLIGGVGELGDIILLSDDPDITGLRQAMSKEQLDNYLEVNAVLDGIRYVRRAAPTPLLFQFATFERYFDRASMQRYADAASEPKMIRWYDTGHELNDPQAFVDRAVWLEKTLGVKSPVPLLPSEAPEIRK